MLRWVEMKLHLRRSPSPSSPTSLNRHSVSFEENTSDEEMRRIRTNSRGRTQNIHKTSGSKLQKRVSEEPGVRNISPESYPQISFPPPPPSRTGVSLNRHL